MIRIAMRFPSGRFHATPWAHHVNEGIPEWPPSPWRILRALAAALYTRCPELDRTIAMAALRRLSVPPAFSLPPAVASHTRHYLSQNKLERTQTKLTFDTFMALERDALVIAHWPAEATAAELRALAAMASEVSYLGRAEAWCDMRLLGQTDDSSPPNCNPSDGTAARGCISTRVLCAAEGFTEQDLGRRTSELQKEGWSDPPGTRWVIYRRPAGAPGPIRRQPAARGHGVRPTVAELLLGGKVLPLFTDAVFIAERMRMAAMACYGSPPSEILSGKNPSGKPLEHQHRHAHYVPEARGQTNRVTHVLVVAPAGFDDREQEALAKISYLKQDDRRDPLDVVLAGFGVEDDFANVSTLFGRSRSWRSKTPFVLPRHPKAKRDSPADQLVRELQLRGFPAPETITPLDGAPLFDPAAADAGRTRWMAFRTARRFSRVTTGVTGFTVEFAEMQRGPMLLGAGSHYGLGQFEQALAGR